MRPLLVLFLACLVGCSARKMTAPNPQRGPDQSDLSAEEQVKVLVCQFLIRTVCTNACGTPFFVRLDDRARAALRSRLPGYHIEAAERSDYVEGFGIRDKMSRKAGVLVGADILTINQAAATARGAYSRTGPAWFYFNLTNEPGWRIGSATRVVGSP